jgi:hypothetical protein
MAAHDDEPSNSLRGVAHAGHVFATHVSADPGLVWTALTAPDRNAPYLYGLAAHSTWVPGDPIECRADDRVELIGTVVYARCHEQLSYLLQAGPNDPPVYLTWRLAPASGGCAVQLEIDEVDAADSRTDAEAVWLPVLAALQLLVNPA